MLSHLLLLLAAARLAMVDPAAVAPAVVERPAASIIYAMGDVHGDYERMMTLLVATHITDQEGHWSAGRATFVVTGDMIDKGPRPVEVIRRLAALRSEAPKAGGEVILLTGNHEAEFLAGPDEKKAADFIADLNKHGISASQVVACQSDIGEVLCSLPVAARVGEWFFSHGGNTSGQTIPQLNAAIAGGKYPLTAPDSILEARLGEGKLHENTQQWIAAPDERALLERYAAALGVKHMVQGHQHGDVQFEGGITRHAGQMFCYQGLLCLIDVGMSREIDDSHGAVLRIVGNHIDAVYPDGSERTLDTSN